MNSIPGIARLDYLDVILTLLNSQAASLDDVRVALGQAIEELALRGEARQSRDWRHPLSYRDTAVDCVRELMRWSLLEVAPLADGAEAFGRIRNLPLRLTPEGRRVAGLSVAERRDIFGQRLLFHYPRFKVLLMVLETQDLLIPELSDTVIRTCFSDPLQVADDQDGWSRVAASCEEAFAGGSTRPNLRAAPTKAMLTEDIGKYLRRRFLKRTPKNVKEVTGAANKAIAQSVLQLTEFRGDWTAYDRCLRWGRDLYVSNDGRHVSSVSGWLAWSTAKVRWSAGSLQVERRGVTQSRDAVRNALAQAYQKIAETRRTVGLQVPLLPIYEVRETTAFECRVCDEVVDRVLAEMASERVEGLVVQFHLADLRGFVPSARPFRLDGKRYFYMSMHNPDKPGEGE